jgi:hypothetical protein
VKKAEKPFENQFNPSKFEEMDLSNQSQIYAWCSGFSVTQEAKFA